MAGKNNQINGSSLRFVINAERGGIPVASVNGALARIEYLYNITVIADEYITQRFNAEQESFGLGPFITFGMVKALISRYYRPSIFWQSSEREYSLPTQNDIGDGDDYFVYAAARLRRFIPTTSLLRVSYLSVGSLDVIFQGAANALKVVVDLIDPTAWRAKKENVRHTEVNNLEDEEHTEVMNDLLEEKQRNENLLAKFNTAGAFIDLIKKAKESNMSEYEIEDIKRLLIRETERVKTGESNIQISQLPPQPQKKKGKRRR